MHAFIDKYVQIWMCISSRHALLYNNGIFKHKAIQTHKHTIYILHTYIHIYIHMYMYVTYVNLCDDAVWHLKKRNNSTPLHCFQVFFQVSKNLHTTTKATKTSH